MSKTYNQCVRLRRPALGLVLVSFACIVLLCSYGSYYFRLLPHEFLKEGLRFLAVPVVAKLHTGDIQHGNDLRKTYWIGPGKLVKTPPTKSWQQMTTKLPGFAVLSSSYNQQGIHEIPFIYEKISAPQLVEVRNSYYIDRLLEGASDEYEAMLRLGAWVGTRWDHGMDDVPGGRSSFRVSDVIKAGKCGSKFSCEIAAKVTIQAATAIGWPARLISASSDGYKYEHGIAELWSNQFNKWFIMDTDFNIVLESDGIPLSAFELCHMGHQLLESGRIHLRRFAPTKPSMSTMVQIKDYINLFCYVHIDMRNDWYSRRLAPGSPAGGDLATWWTARPDLGPMLTAKIRVDDRDVFNWPVNTTWIFLGNITPAADGYVLNVLLNGYSPYFEVFSIQLDDFAWQTLKSYQHSLVVSKGTHTIRARIKTKTGYEGPTASVTFHIP
ncbi:MAG: hypothetical protein JRD93_02645 [Deltaproteobacteria bacterium]|nr:hypothetical protein [Deltaproteobacteria bacterium]